MPTTFLLGSIVLASVALRLAVGAMVPAPAIFPDEFVYWELGRGLADSGHLLIRDQPVTAWTFGPLYPLLISPVHLLARSPVEAYAIVKAINALALSLSAVPAYFLARRVLSRRGSLAAAVLTVLVPSAVYATRVMAESLSYPLFLTAMVAMVAALGQPSYRRQLAAMAAILLASFARAEMFILFPAFACAIVVLARFEARRGSEQSFTARVLAFRVTWIFEGIAGLLVVVLGAMGSLGPHVALLRSIRPSAVPANILWHLADLDFYSGVIPFAAFFLVAGAMFTARTASRTESAFIVLSATVAASVIILAAVFESAFKLSGVSNTHVFDRYDFYLVPLFVISLLLWVEKELPRPRYLLAVAAGAALLPLSLPLESLLTGREWGTSTSSVGLVPLWWAKALIGGGWVLRAVLLGFTCTLALALLRTGIDRRWRLVRISGQILLFFTLLVGVSNVWLSEKARTTSGRNELGWVDKAVGPDTTVAIVWSGDNTRPPPQRLALREAEFFNQSIGPVYDLQDPLNAGFPSTRVTIGRKSVLDAAGRAVRAAYVLAPGSLAIRGQPLIRDPGSGLVLYRVSGAIRIKDQ
jgi:hypothetical protein